MSTISLPKHLLRYGIHSEQRYFTELDKCYEGVAINGNMLAHTPVAIAKFVAEKIINTPFVIDPQTHAFQHDPQLLRRDVSGESKETGPVLKSSIEKMSKQFGEPIVSRAGFEAVLPIDFEDNEIRREFCKRVIQFQSETIEQYSENKDFKQYLDFAGIKTMQPAVVIAPYFYMRSNTMERWLPVNINIINDSVKCEDSIPVYAQIVIDKELVHRRSFRDNIISQYGGTDCKGIFLWMDNVNEHDADKELLQGIIDFIRGMGKYGKKVHIVYGGYFSAILTQFANLSGFCHGLEYGESRPVIPVGGGIPMSKYYFPPLHKRLRYSELIQIIEAKGWAKDPDAFHANVCDCEVCKRVIAGNMENLALFGKSKPITVQRRNQTITLYYPLPETKDLCLRHYLNCKKSELDKLSRSSKDQIVNELRLASSTYERTLGEEAVAFASVWADVLDELEIAD